MARKILSTLLIISTALFIFAFSDKRLPLIDAGADRYFSETIAEAALAYATVRGVNAVVSVLKESQVEFSPAGVGLNIAAGQILDPIDDMTERLSAVMVTALVSLGLQKLVMEITSTVPLLGAAVIALLFGAALWLKPQTRAGLTPVILRVGAVLLIFRFILPLSSLLSESLYRHALKDEINRTERHLSRLSEGYRQLSGFDDSHGSGIGWSLSQTARNKVEQTKLLFKRITEEVDDFIGALLKLTILYVSLFVLQVIAIPVLMLWAMFFLVNGLFKAPGLVIPCSPSPGPAAGGRQPDRSSGRGAPPN